MLATFLNGSFNKDKVIERWITSCQTHHIEEGDIFKAAASVFCQFFNAKFFELINKLVFFLLNLD